MSVGFEEGTRGVLLKGQGTITEGTRGGADGIQCVRMSWEESGPPPVTCRVGGEAVSVNRQMCYEAKGLKSRQVCL